MGKIKSLSDVEKRLLYKESYDVANSVYMYYNDIHSLTLNEMFVMSEENKSYLIEEKQFKPFGFKYIEKGSIICTFNFDKKECNNLFSIFGKYSLYNLFISENLNPKIIIQDSVMFGSGAEFFRPQLDVFVDQEISNQQQSAIKQSISTIEKSLTNIQEKLNILPKKDFSTHSKKINNTVFNRAHNKREFIAFLENIIKNNKDIRKGNIKDRLLAEIELYNLQNDKNFMNFIPLCNIKKQNIKNTLKP